MLTQRDNLPHTFDQSPTSGPLYRITYSSRELFQRSDSARTVRTLKQLPATIRDAVQWTAGRWLVKSVWQVVSLCRTGTVLMLCYMHCISILPLLPTNQPTTFWRQSVSWLSPDPTSPPGIDLLNYASIPTIIMAAKISNGAVIMDTEDVRVSKL